MKGNKGLLNSEMKAINAIFTSDNYMESNHFASMNEAFDYSVSYIGTDEHGDLLLHPQHAENGVQWENIYQ